jgi:hypothetical protein
MARHEHGHRPRWLQRIWHPWRPDDIEPETAKEAVEQARADLHETRALDADIDALAARLNRTAKRNHFSEAMEALAAEMSKQQRHT